MLPSENIRGLSDRWCWIALLLVIIGTTVIRGRLLSVPLERDEGEYAYIGQQLLKGVPPYISGYSMKLPGIYAVYAGIMAVFGETITGIHMGLAVFNAATIILIFLLTKRMFGGLAGVAAGSSYAILSLLAPVQGIFANSEHFLILFALAGVVLLSSVGKHIKATSKNIICHCERGEVLSFLSEKPRLPRRCAPRNDIIRGGLNQAIVFIAGLFLGFAFIIKQHGIFFSIFGAAYLLYRDFSHRPVRWKTVLIDQFIFIAGAIIPFAFICLFYSYIGEFGNFWFWTFTYAREYTGKIPITAAWELLRPTISPIIAYSFSIWILALAGLFRIIFQKADRMHLPFVIGFLIFSFLTVCPGFYFRGHYFILIFPAVTVLSGAGFSWLAGLLPGRIPIISRRLVIVTAGLIIIGFSLFQQRLYLFSLSPYDISHLFYGGCPFPESVEAARFIRDNGEPNDTIAVVGSEPQIYFYLGRRSATRYIYTYFLMWERRYGAGMQREMIGEIESAKPKWIVFVGSQTSWTQMEDSITDIFTWFRQYVDNNYDIAGIIEVHPHKGEQPVYRWNEQAKDYSPATEDWLKVYKRKP